MVESTIEPKSIQIDKIRRGIATILVHWDIGQIERETDFGKEMLWQYEECRMDWILPQAYESREEVEEYLANVEEEILNWVKGAKVSL